MKCFYHNDLDGRCAGSIVSIFTNNFNKEDFYEVDYIKDLYPLIINIKREQIWFVDYSFTENTCHILQELLGKGCDIIWIDHHISSINLCENHKELNNIKGIRKEGISGAGLTYMYCYNKELLEEIPYYIQLVSDYDCWKYIHEPDTTYFKLGMEYYDFDALDKIWQCLCEDYILDIIITLNKIIEKGKLIKQYIDNENTYYRENFSYESEICGHKCLVVNKKTNSWVFGEKYNEYPIVMIWVFDGKKYTYSIFSSNKDIDCSKIAECYGGGGHKGASGFSSDKLLFKEIKND